MQDKYKLLIKKDRELELFKTLYLEERDKNLDLTITLDYLKQQLYLGK